MSFNLDSITKGSGIRPPRIILLGVEKIGKSTFASCSESPIFLPIKGEEGIDALDVLHFPTCNSLDNVLEALYSIWSGDHLYGTVVIDSASALEPLVWARTCRENSNADSIEKVNGGYGKGYTEALYRWRLVTDALDALRKDKNMASIIIGHVKVKRFDDPAGDSYDQYQFDIHDKASSLLYRWADVILFCNRKVVVKEEKLGFHKDNVRKRGIDMFDGARFLYTQKRPAHPGGGRGVFGQLPYELSLSWQAFMEAVSAASQT